LQIFFSFLVFDHLFWLIVYRSVSFNYQSPGRAIEISDVIADAMLTLEFQAKLIIAEFIPEHSFRRRRPRSERPAICFQ
jgi:hypothetical protein